MRELVQAKIRGRGSGVGGVKKIPQNWHKDIRNFLEILPRITTKISTKNTRKLRAQRPENFREFFRKIAYNFLEKSLGNLEYKLCENI